MSSDYVSWTVGVDTSCTVATASSDDFIPTTTYTTAEVVYYYPGGDYAAAPRWVRRQQKQREYPTLRETLQSRCPQRESTLPAFRGCVRPMPYQMRVVGHE